MKKQLIFGFVLIFISTTLSAQQSLKDQGLATWKTLSAVKLEMRFDEDFQLDVEYPVFESKVKALNGKEIIISGYLVPLEELGRKASEQFFILSALPFNLCFFCGNAGPETVMEVFSLDRIKFSNDIITIKGRLELNDSDPMRLMYILKDARKL